MAHPFVHDWFAATAARHPDAVAIEQGEHRCTYQELRARANDLAASLIAAGASRGDLIAIFTRDDLARIPAVLGVLEAGCAFLTLDPAFPDAQLSAWLEAAPPALALVDDDLRPRLDAIAASAGSPCRAMLSITTPASRAGEEAIRADWASDDCCYIFFTSGSTGRAKPIAGRLKAIDHFIRWEIRTLGLDAGIRVSQLVAPTFDAWLRDIFVPLCAGGTVCLPESRELVRDGAALADWIDRAGIELIHTVPSVFRQVLPHVTGPHQFARLRHVLLSGEALPGAVVKAWRSTFGSRVQLVNLYGPSETTMVKFAHVVDAEDEEWPTVSIGRPIDGAPRPIQDAQGPPRRPIDGAQGLILDDEGHPCVMGEAGEIFIRTPYRSLGYYRRPDLTDQVFVRNPFSDDPNDLLYKTGDLGRFLPDGRLEFRGRRDQQIKIHGIRIEPAEIEAVLATHPAVARSVVVARADTPETKRLIAYVVGRPRQAIDAADLRAHARRHLPEYMVPAAIVGLDAFPLTPSGKLDLQALPAPAAGTPGAAPRTPIEELVAAIWGDVLQRDPIGRDDDFFALGGHSLLAARMLARINAGCGIDLPLHTVFDSPTVAALAEAIERRRAAWDPDSVVVPPLRPVARAGPLPLAPAQQRFWFLHQLNPDSPAYHCPTVVRFHSAVDGLALRASLDALVARHEALRTTFPALDNGTPVQSIAPASPAALTWIDISDMPTDARERTARGVAKAAVEHPFDLARGPLFRTHVIRLAAEDHLLVMVCHHIISDAASLGVIAREVTTLYEAHRAGVPANLPPLPVQYADVAMWQQTWLQGEVLDAQLTYWRRQLANPPVLDLPTDFAWPAVGSSRGALAAHTLSPELCASLRALAQREGTTLFMVLLAAWSLLLGRLTGQDDLIVGTPTANRTRVELEGLIGCFINTLALRADLRGRPTFRDLLARIRTTVLDAHAHRDLPFEQIVETLAPNRDRAREPIVDVVLNFVSELAGVNVEGLKADEWERPSFPSKMTMTLYALARSSSTLDLRLVYRTDLFTPQRMEVMLEQLHVLLQQISEDPAAAIDSYSLVPSAHAAQLPNPAEPLASVDYRPIGNVFLDVAARTPEAPAVRAGGIDYSYRELSTAARRIAAAVIERTPAAGDVVAVRGARSYGVIAGMLGVLLARRVLLTIDPALPVARRQVMLREARVRCLLSIGDAADAADPADATDAALAADPSVPVITISASGEIDGAFHRERRGEIGCEPDDATLALPEVHAADPAYIFFTSGTSGVPKGVLGLHRGLSRFLHWQRETFAIGGGDRCAHLTGLSFDVVLRDVFVALTSGATLCLPDADVEIASEEIPVWMAQERITVVHAVPSLARAWLRASGAIALPDLRWIFSAGEPLHEGLVRQWRAVTNAGLVNLYGPTEATLANCYEVVGAEPKWGVQPVGRPLPGTQALVLAHERMCGLGEPGEIVLRSRFLTAGYINASGEEAQRFAANPFRAGTAVNLDDGDPDDGAPDDRLYRTGDRGRYALDGTLEILGRLDDQIKIRGNRIEPAEVEHALRSHPAIDAAAVVVSHDQEGPRLIAYVVQAANAAPDAAPTPAALSSATHSPTAHSPAALPSATHSPTAHSPAALPSATHSPAAHSPAALPSAALSAATLSSAALRAYLRTRLPDYMVPAAFVRLAALPLTPNGKVDRQALPAPADDAADDDGADAPPRTPVEEIVANIWADLLRRRGGLTGKSLSRHADFFALGGHSLLATQVVARVRAALGVEVPLRTLFDAPTLAALAAAIDARRAGAGGPVPPPLLPVSRDGPLPLGFAQQRLWFLQHLAPGSAAYHCPAALRLRGPLDVVALHASLDALVERHEALRTTFPAIDGVPWQSIAPVAPRGGATAGRLEGRDDHRSSDPLDHHVAPHLIDLTALPADRRAAVADALAAREARRPFSLDRGPLLRVHLLRLAADDHLLLITLHHIVCDGSSVAILVRELSTCYHAARTGTRAAAALPPLPVQPADVAVWQRQWLAGEVLDAQLDYWRRQLADTPVLDLPTDTPRPAVASHRGETVSLHLPAALTGELRALAQQTHSTLFMVLVSAWALLLSRISGQNDLVIGTPIAGRTQIETEGLIGCFINTLALRLDLSGRPTFHQLLARVRAIVLDAYAHQELPFEQIVDALAPARDLSREPLVQTMFILQTAAPNDTIELPDLRIDTAGRAERDTKYDLLLGLIEDTNALNGTIEFAADLFARSSIETLGARYQRLLRQIAADPDQSIDHLSLFDDDERGRLELWNQTERKVPPGAVHEWIAAQAARTPDAVAAVFHDQHLTYGALMSRANQLAMHLAERGVGSETRVAVCLPRGLELITALLAVLEARGAYVPLDAAYPASRLNYMLEDSRAIALITDRDAPIVPPAGLQLVQLPLDDAAGDDRAPAAPRTSRRRRTRLPAGRIDRHDSRPLRPATDPASLAYVIYTSGSTGLPKGVAISHAALSNFLRSMEATLRFGPRETLLAVTTLSFDIAGLELYLPLMTGARLVIADQDSTRDGALLAALCEAEHVTAMQATPTTWRLLLQEWEELSGLRALCGGEALPDEVAAMLLRRGAELWNLYGPTETTIWSLIHQSTDDAKTAIGRPIANTRLYVIDACGELAPIGAVGELAIGGDGLARGYWQRRAETARRFQPDPFSGAPGARLYLTGDLVRWRTEGTLVFLGRRDHQVKVRGFRIELGEIETVLARHPGVRQAVVVTRDTAAHGPQLVAYIVPASGSALHDGSHGRPHAGLTPAALRAHVRAQLPDYMVPSAFVEIEALPLTLNGKVDRQALPAPAADAAADDGDAPPRTPVEEILANIWAGLLQRGGGVDGGGLGRHADFFALGGHSLLATQVVARVRAALGVEVPLRTLFDAPTLAALAAAIDARRAGAAAGGPVPPPLIRVPRDGLLPLAFTQQRLWFLQQLEPTSAAYHLPIALGLHGPLDATALHASLDALVARHEALRTTFPAIDGVPWQSIAPVPPRDGAIARRIEGSDIHRSSDPPDHHVAARGGATAGHLEGRDDHRSPDPHGHHVAAQGGATAGRRDGRDDHGSPEPLDHHVATRGGAIARRLEGRDDRRPPDPHDHHVAAGGGATAGRPEGRDDHRSPDPLDHHVAARWIDLTALPADRRAAVADGLAAREARRPFALDRGPLLRVHLLRLAADEHRLLITLHHIICDGWSVAILIRELSAGYHAARTEAGADALPPLPVQPADVAVWQRQWLAGDVLDGQLAYWRRQLADAPVLDLPTDAPRPAVASHRGDTVPLRVPASLTTALRTLARETHATLFMVLVSAWALLLSRLSGQNDLVIGTPIAGRTQLETEGLIGCFINTLALRLDLSGRPTFHELLARVRATVLDAYAHQDLPFEQLVDTLAPPRDRSREPLVQTMFILQPPTRGDTLDLPDVHVHTEDRATRESKFDLLLGLNEDAGTLSGTIEFAADLFNPATITAFGARWLHLLEQIAARPGEPLDQLTLIDDDERQRLDAANQHEPLPPPAAASVPEWIAAQTARTPDAIAVTAGDRQLTYRALDTCANRLARQLAAAGVGPDVRVAICMSRGLELLPALLAVMKAGGAYVPLDPAYPAARLAYMLADAAPRVLLTDGCARAALPPLPADLTVLEVATGTEPHARVARPPLPADLTVLEVATGAEPHARVARPPLPADLTVLEVATGAEPQTRVEGSTASASDAEAVPARIVPEQLAYVLYTSGSTGQPKGVAIDHASVTAFVQWATQAFPRDAFAGTLAATSICFDLSIFELFVPLCVGGRVLLADNALAIGTLPARDAITLVNTVPAAAREWLRLGALPASVTHVNLAGEPLASALAAAVYAQPGVEALANLYGPTEATTYATAAVIPRTDRWPPGIGKPIAQTKTYVLDAHGHLAPYGAIGELAIGGAGLARGYLLRPDATAARFVPDPFSAVPGARLYLTGDLARWRSDGSLAFLGRRDHQIKLRGFRIELGEIETVLSKHPEVQHSVVIARPDPGGGDARLVAYIVAAPSTTGTAAPAAAALRAHARTALPDYMVPADFVVLDALPLTPNGKLDRQALPAPERGAMVEADGDARPRTPVEEMLAGIWADVLKRDVRTIGRDDDFFTLGGHSLLATQVLARLRTAFDVQPSLRTLFDAPTLAGLAAALDDLRNENHGAAPSAPPPLGEVYDAEFDALLADVESLSEEEAEAALATEAAHPEDTQVQ